MKQTNKFQHGGPRRNAGGARPGAGRKPHRATVRDGQTALIYEIQDGQPVWSDERTFEIFIIKRGAFKLSKGGREIFIQLT